MSPPVAAMIIIGCVAAVGFWYYWSSGRKKKYESQVHHHGSYQGGRASAYGGRCSSSYTSESWSDTNYQCSNPNNNHDQQKYKHATRESAEAEIQRMQRMGVKGSERLKAYYNSELDGWYVGRSKYDRRAKHVNDDDSN